MPPSTANAQHGAGDRAGCRVAAERVRLFEDRGSASSPVATVSMRCWNMMPTGPRIARMIAALPGRGPTSLVLADEDEIDGVALTVPVTLTA